MDLQRLASCDSSEVSDGLIIAEVEEADFNRHFYSSLARRIGPE